MVPYKSISFSVLLHLHYSENKIQRKIHRMCIYSLTRYTMPDVTQQIYEIFLSFLTIVQCKESLCADATVNALCLRATVILTKD